MTHITCRLTAKNRDQLWNPTLCNRVWDTSNSVFGSCNEIFFIDFHQGLRGPYGKGLVGHCTSGHSLNPLLSLLRSSRDHSVDPGRCTRSGAVSYPQQLLPAPDINRYLACSKPAACCCRCRSTGQTDLQTDGHPTVTWTLIAYYVASANNYTKR